MLKDGSVPDDPRLGRLYEEDWNSLNYPVTQLLSTIQPYENYKPRGYTWGIDTCLDQGPDGACVGFSFAHDMIARPDTVRSYKGSPVDFRFAKERIYWEAQKIDEWDGGAYPGANPVYEGSSILAGAKVLHALGLYSSYHWALNLKQLVLGVGYTGPAIVGTNWYEGMFEPDANGFLRPTGRVVGGHAYLIYGVKIEWTSWISRYFSKKWENVDRDKSYLKVHNSWGPGWGENGNAKISLRDFDKLLHEQGDVCFPRRSYLYS